MFNEILALLAKAFLLFLYLAAVAALFTFFF